MMNADQADQPLRAIASAQFVADTFEIVWPSGGIPLALDPASAAIRDCFDPPATPRTIASELTEAVGLEPAIAAQSVNDVVALLRAADHLVPADQADPPEILRCYPPSASP